MGLTDRQARMAEWLNAHGRGTVQELAAAFFVSEMTVRRAGATRSATMAGPCVRRGRRCGRLRSGNC